MQERADFIERRKARLFQPLQNIEIHAYHRGDRCGCNQQGKK